MARRRTFGTGGATVSLEWVNEGRVAAGLVAVEKGIRQVELPLSSARFTLIRAVEESFAGKADQDGNPWPQWAKSYRKEAEATNIDGLLQRENKLYIRVTNPASYPIRGNALFIKRDALEQSYGALHETGTDNNRSELPRRSFIYPGTTTQARIFATFRAWLDNTVAIYTRGGKTFRQLRDPGGSGRFVSRPEQIL